MYTFLLVLLIIVSVVVVSAVLLQSGKGGGLAASFGGASSSTDALIGSRQAGNLLTKISWIGGGVFIFLAFVLQLMSVRTRTPKSVLDQPLSQTPAPVTAPPTTKSGPVIPLQSTTPATKGGAAPVVPLEKTPPKTVPSPAPKK